MRRTSTTTLLVTIGVGAVVALSGCTGGDAAPDRSPSATRTPTDDATPTGATTATPAVEPESGPTPSSTSLPAAAVGSIPSTCSDLVTAGRWPQFASMPLNDPGVVGDPPDLPTTEFTPALQQGGARLYCVWRDPRADVTNLVIDVATVDPSKAVAAMRSLSGFDCADEADGYRCQRVTQNPQYPVTDGRTLFTRGDVAIRITQSNIPTQGLLDDVRAHVFG